MRDNCVYDLAQVAQSHGEVGCACLRLRCVARRRVAHGVDDAEQERVEEEEDVELGIQSSLVWQTQQQASVVIL